jgi:cytidylate kinase
LAERLGVEFYDKALIRRLEEKYHLTADEIEKIKGRERGFWADFKRVARLGEGWGLSDQKVCGDGSGEENEKPTTDEMFKVESAILHELAANGSCVVAGRSGFFVFRQHPNHLCILIQASLPARIERLMRKRQMTEEEARRTIEKVDMMRENYVKHYTGTSRYDTRNYHLVITADGKTEDEMVDVIWEYIGKVKK